MYFVRAVKQTFRGNYLFVGGLLLGALLSLRLQDTECDSDDTDTDDTVMRHMIIDGANVSQSPAIRTAAAAAAKTRQGPLKIIRPRYYSTELGIKEKIFVGVFTSVDKIAHQAININRTVAHLVDKIKFFITASSKFKNNATLSGIVGFTDTREKYRPFQVVKYVGDAFLQDYDYFFFMNDFNYLNARKLKDVVTKISVKRSVYMGTTDTTDSSFCSLDAGILLSNSVLRAMKENLDWCVRNIVSDDHAANIGRCVSHSTSLDCQDVVQGQQLRSYKIKHYDLTKHLLELTRSESFNDAISVYPVLQPSDIYLLHAYFSRQSLTELHAEIETLGAGLTQSWPPGQRPGNKPATRFDLPVQHYFNTTHMFFPDDFINVAAHTRADREDIERVIEAVKSKAVTDVHKFRRLVNGYRTFDLSRGMDYYLDLGFKDLTTGREIVKRFQVSKPLGKVELLSVPYVTENIKVTILLPIQETEIDLAEEFIGMYADSIIDRREKSYLMLVFLYDYNSPSKGPNDVFRRIKTLATSVSDKYRNDNAKVAWLSIRLPDAQRRIVLQRAPLLNLAIVDLALKKVGLESLVLVLDVHCDIKYDFLNRVRMNTIASYQIFSAVPFRQFDPKVTQTDRLDVYKTIGHFDKQSYKYVSFYARDYVNVRKLSKAQVPIVRNDGDIVRLLDESIKHSGNVYELFVEHSPNLHCMRATDMSLKVKHHVDDATDSGTCNLFIGSKIELAKMILDREST